jgi:hypothetical protein
MRKLKTIGGFQMDAIQKLIIDNLSDEATHGYTDLSLVESTDEHCIFSANDFLRNVVLIKVVINDEEYTDDWEVLEQAFGDYEWNEMGTVSTPE